ncbi:uncharacterized protein BT62DRAFT_482634 [Guyanagaster necrorhizus]|uniref:Uncharacterized protein n=1 Tax=Guyanagaster necrorhizus TaxID=856835 RepID=A0A9P7VJK2_9AGAR|nr:uncharacterized protein BT62DRAFT_482634 [Guyanagaster necrorhizus MCA 3950]KAG7441525.1 hypothetical protein BT62DRAFT_482634 [Guyanagaster necrorhizus MCA 3950]
MIQQPCQFMDSILIFFDAVSTRWSSHVLKPTAIDDEIADPAPDMLTPPSWGLTVQQHIEALQKFSILCTSTLSLKAELKANIVVSVSIGCLIQTLCINISVELININKCLSGKYCKAKTPAGSLQTQPSLAAHQPGFFSRENHFPRTEKARDLASKTAVCCPYPGVALRPRNTRPRTIHSPHSDSSPIIIDVVHVPYP